jgi:hypothetical protein
MRDEWKPIRCGSPAPRLGISIGQFDNPVGEEEAQRAGDKFRNAEYKIAQGGNGTGVAVLTSCQEVFKKIVEAAQKIIEAVKNDEKSNGPDDDAKEFGWFHVIAKRAKEV